jgi:catechol 2,3-dioxygenase-like lactoylglutathione lyase family enzyme
LQLLDHISISVRDIGRAKRFYTEILAALGAVVAYDRDDAIGFGERSRPHDDRHTYVTIYQSRQGASDSKCHWCFRAQSKEEGDTFHAAGLAAVGKDEGAPGLRSYHAGYYAAFPLDPEGNEVEAVYHHAGA